VNISVGYLLPTISILTTELVKLKSDTTIVHCQGLIQNILSSIEARFGSYFKVRDYRIAAFVHPKFKLNWLLVEEKEQAINDLNDEVEMERERSGPVDTESRNPPGTFL
jgi:hypothetical protein